MAHMQQRRASALITPALAGVFLAAFALSGLMTGALARGFVHSLLATPPVPTPSATPRRTPTHQPKVQAVPTLPVPSVPFALQLSVSAQHVSSGDKLTVVSSATAEGTSTPLGGVPCVLRAPRNGTAPLLATWPAPQSTDVRGKATWQITVPQLAAGWYGIEVSANGTSNYSFWTWARVYVNG
jgi:hypothetical protein